MKSKDIMLELWWCSLIFEYSDLRKDDISQNEENDDMKFLKEYNLILLRTYLKALEEENVEDLLKFRNNESILVNLI